MRNPSAITDEVLSKIKRLLIEYKALSSQTKFPSALKTSSDIQDVLSAIDYAEYGETDEELMASFEEFHDYGGC